MFILLPALFLIKKSCWRRNKAYMGENFKKSCLPLIVVAFITEIFYISKIFLRKNLRWDVSSSLVCNFITYVCSVSKNYYTNSLLHICCFPFVEKWSQAIMYSRSCGLYSVHGDSLKLGSIGKQHLLYSFLLLF